MASKMSTHDEGKKLLREFESMTQMAELRALSRVSVERKLNDKEFTRMMELAMMLGLRV